MGDGEVGVGHVRRGWYVGMRAVRAWAPSPASTALVRRCAPCRPRRGRCHRGHPPTVGGTQAFGRDDQAGLLEGTNPTELELQGGHVREGHGPGRCEPGGAAWAERQHRPLDGSTVLVGEDGSDRDPAHAATVRLRAGDATGPQGADDRCRPSRQDHQRHRWELPIERRSRPGGSRYGRSRQAASGRANQARDQVTTKAHVVEEPRGEPGAPRRPRDSAGRAPRLSSSP